MLRVTVAKYFLPSGRCLHRGGVAPSVVVESGIPGEEPCDLKGDSQLRRAVREALAKLGLDPATIREYRDLPKD